MRCDYGVVRLFFTLHTQKEVLLTSVEKTVNFPRALACGPYTPVGVHNLPPCSPLSSNLGMVDGGFLLEARSDFLKPGACREGAPWKGVMQSTPGRFCFCLAVILTFPRCFPNQVLAC